MQKSMSTRGEEPWNLKADKLVSIDDGVIVEASGGVLLLILTRYGIIQERFSALLTDSIRGNLLEYCGYKTQLLEFIDFAHTPKNILIRATLRPSTPNKTKEKALSEVQRAIDEFNVNPTLYKLLIKDT